MYSLHSQQVLLIYLQQLPFYAKLPMPREIDLRNLMQFLLQHGDPNAEFESIRGGSFPLSKIPDYLRGLFYAHLQERLQQSPIATARILGTVSLVDLLRNMTASLDLMTTFDQRIHISIEIKLKFDDFVPSPVSTELLLEIRENRTVDLTQDTRIRMFMAIEEQRGGRTLLELTSTDTLRLARLLKPMFQFFNTDNLIDLVPAARQQELQILIMTLRAPDPRLTINCFVCKKPTDQECTRCGRAAYCSVACQRKDWLQHRSICYKQDQN
jgi:hypothetical protein